MDMNCALDRKAGASLCEERPKITVSGKFSTINLVEVEIPSALPRNIRELSALPRFHVNWFQRQRKFTRNGYPIARIGYLNC
jgi:hypothetical protein